MNRVLITLLILCLPGCASLNSALDVLDLYGELTAPVPVCDAESVGLNMDGKTCLKYSDGTYQWFEKKGDVE